MQILLLSYRIEKFSHNIHNGWMKIQIQRILQHCVWLTLSWYVQGFFYLSLPVLCTDDDHCCRP